MADRIDQETEGAWIIHHGRKIALDVAAPAEFPALDESAKAADFLLRLGQTSNVSLTGLEVEAVAKAANLNPRSELPHYLGILEKQRLIERSNNDVNVLGVSSRAALTHASDLFANANPSDFEKAAIDLAENSSLRPLKLSRAEQYVSDTYKLKTADAVDFVQRSIQVGFIDAEGEDKNRLIFNGNLFKRDSIAKTDAVVSSLSSADQAKVNEFASILQNSGCVLATYADRILGDSLFEKLKAAGLFEVNIVSNEHGEHAFVNAPGAFHKFVNPLVDDCFDMAKALVSALTYGKTLRSASQGRIVNVTWILNALISKRLIGPATAIGNDYRVLEENRVVKLTPASGGMFYMQLLKTDIGVLALEVLSRGEANAEAIRAPLAAPMTGYIGPERTRIQVRRNQKQASRRSTHDILSALRGGRRV